MIQDLLQLAHLLHELVGVVGGHQLGDLVEAVELLLDLSEALLHVAEDGLLLVQRRLLLEDADRRAGREQRLAVVGVLQPGHDPQNRRLPCAVRADHTDLGARQEVQRHVIENDLVAVGLPDLLHAVDELRHALDGSCVRLMLRRRLDRGAAPVDTVFAAPLAAVLGVSGRGVGDQPRIVGSEVAARIAGGIRDGVGVGGPCGRAAVPAQSGDPAVARVRSGPTANPSSSVTVCRLPSRRRSSASAADPAR